ncbi:MAG: S-ribosylhomocysteine lyase [Spirochaetaceae bacterium]|jgi:S-ribosylhomocysteine lyase|nr:S-ribosylhomocysteine lyase [Spirochaetaceae bacterium]
MEKIASFQINHLLLRPGLYVSRKDTFDGAVITTFDLRFKAPNIEPAIDQPALHTMEHLCATFLRNHKEWGPRIVYFGPMGCRTGSYVVMHGDLSSSDVLPVMREMCAWFLDFEGEVPGAAPEDCGNYLEHNLTIAKWEIRLWAEVLAHAGPEQLIYPPKNPG